MSKPTNPTQTAIPHSNIVAAQVGPAGSGEYYSTTMQCPRGSRELTPHAQQEIASLQQTLNRDAQGWINMLHQRGVAQVDVLVSDVTSACGYQVPACTQAKKGQVCRK